MWFYISQLRGPHGQFYNFSMRWACLKDMPYFKNLKSNIPILHERVGWGFTPTTIRRTSFAPRAVIFSTTSVQRLAAIASVKVPVHRQQPFKPRPKGVESGSVFSLSFGIFSFYFSSQQKRKKSTFFISKQFFIFFSLLRTKKRKRSKRKEMTHCFLQPYGCELNGCCR